MNTLGFIALAYAASAPFVALLLGKLMSHDSIHQSQALSPHRHRDLLSADCSIRPTRLDQQEGSAGDHDQGGSGFHHGERV